MQNGNCEVLPDKPCIWTQAWSRSQKMPAWRDHMAHVNPPVDWQLKGTGSWENRVSGRDRQTPAGWQPRPTDDRIGSNGHERSSSS